MEPHPITGQEFASPVPPGTGWPGDPATADTPVAATVAQVRRLAKSATTVEQLDARISVCRACPRLVKWRESVAVDGRRASFAAEPYWGRPGHGFGDSDAEILLVGLAPAANGTNRTGRMFTGDHSGDVLYAALYRTGFASQPTSVGAGDGLTLTNLRIIASVRCAPPLNRPTAAEKAACAPWLDRDLQLAEPRVHTIMALGGFGWNAALSSARRIGWTVPRPKPKFGHAAETTLVTDTGREVRFVGCYHVSPHNTFTGKLTEPMLDEVLRSLHGPRDIRLVAPDTAYQRSYLEAADEFGDGVLHGDGDWTLPPDASGFAGVSFSRADLDTADGFARFVAWRRAAHLEESPRPGQHVPWSPLWIVENGTYLGSLSIRHRLTDFLLNEGGHIGYSVRPSARRRGVATAALGLALPIARSLGIESVLLTCDEDNEASRRTIEHHGGVLEDVRGSKRRYWIDTGATTPDQD